MKTSMDAIQFGKWMSERRRKRGWSSQRTMIETIRQDPFFKDVRISEDFLARLEAGRLVYPFRGYVRQQVLGLAWLLCSTPREVQVYLQAAALKDLSAEEHELVQQLYAHVSRPAVTSIELLPVRPQRLVGQDTLVQKVLNQLCTMEHGVCALTGMPGVGKSALASEVVHRLVSEGYSRIFHHGIVTISCKGRRGTQGLLSLLHEVINILSPAQEHRSQAQSDASLAFWLDRMETHLASVVDQVRVLLMDKSVLFLLDDLDAQFPLRTALDALLGSTQRNAVQAGHHRNIARHVVLTTSRHIPSLALVSYHHHIQPLLHPDACALFHALTASMTAATLFNLDEEQEQAAGQICNTVGYLPLAIELVANAVAVRGIPLNLLATNTAFDPFHPLLDNNGELGELFEQAFSNIGHEQHKHFSLLALLGPQAFSLEVAAALFQQEKREEESASFESVSRLISVGSGRSTTTEVERSPEPGSLRNFTPELTRMDNPYVSFQALTSTALELGYLVNDSLLERVATETPDLQHNQQQYMLHPLLYAYARNCVQRLPGRYLDAVWSNFQAYMSCLCYSSLEK